MKKIVVILLCFAATVSAAGLRAQAPNPFPAKAPAGVTSQMDFEQMVWQLGITFPEMTGDLMAYYHEIILPKLVASGSDVRYEDRGDGRWRWGAGTSSVATDYIHGIAPRRSPFGLSNNYIEAWEPGGDYFTGVQFYKPLALHDLTGVTPRNWPSRRAGILAEVQRIWGTIPAEAHKLKVAWQEEPAVTGVSEGYGYTQRTLTGTVGTSSYPDVRDVPVIRATLRLPVVEAGAKVPVIIHIGGNDIDPVLWRELAARGIGLLRFDCQALQPDNGAGLTSYLIGLVNRGAWRNPSDWGTIGAWSWGISRLIDRFEKSDDVDASKIGVTGHSRYGKAALVAMAYDTRIALGAPTASGSLGMVQSRRHWGQDLETSIFEREYHWLAGNFMLYGSVHPSSTDGYMPRKVLDMPVDAESLVALCAPRPLFVGVGSLQASGGDTWVDPYGQYLACVAANPVYEMLGARGLVMNDSMDYRGTPVPMPVPGKEYTAGAIAFYRYDGSHAMAEMNYAPLARFAAGWLR